MNLMMVCVIVRICNLIIQCIFKSRCLIVFLNAYFDILGSRSRIGRLLFSLVEIIVNSFFSCMSLCSRFSLFLKSVMLVMQSSRWLLQIILIVLCSIWSSYINVDFGRASSVQYCSIAVQIISAYLLFMQQLFQYHLIFLRLQRFSEVDCLFGI